MAFVLADRVKETTTSPGTGTATLNGAASGYQSFSAGIGANNTTYYTIADQSGTNWEVGYGTIGAGGTTLARTTVLASSNSGSLVNFSSGTQDVWCDYAAKKAVIQDTNSNVFANNFIPAVTTTSSSATPINLTVLSPQYQIVNGTTTSQTFNLPDATTLSVGDTYYFNNNITYSSVQINAHDGTTSILALQAGGAAHLILLTNSTTNGTWDVHSYIPSSVSWGNATLNFNSSSSISGPVTWQGNTVGVGYGGTGLTSTPANGALDIGNGTNFTRTTLTQGTGISITNGSGSITIANSGVTSVTGTSPVSSSGGATPAISLASGYGDTQNPYASKTANYVLAAPNGSAGVPTFRAIVAADIPTLNQNTTGSAGSVTNALTMNNSGSGAASGTTYNGSAAYTISYNTIGASPLAGSSSLTTTGTVTSGTWSGSFGAVSGANLTSLNGSNISSGTVAAARLGSGTPSSSNYLRGDGTWSTVSASPAGSTTQVQYNSSGSFAGSANFTFDGTNVLVAGTVSGGSDERLKKNWRSVVSNFIEKLSKVKAGIFDRTDLELTQPGVSAQSLREVLPEAVLEDENGMLSVNYGGAALLSVIELAKEVVALRAEIEALKAK